MAQRKGIPCAECGKIGCKSTSTFACWIRSHKRVLAEHDYIRCGDHTRLLRAAEVDLLRSPQVSGSEAYYGPQWAVLRLQDLRWQAKKEGWARYGARIEAALRADARHGPRPAALAERLEELRAFAVLRGWKFAHGSWSR